jgi:PAS domain S-box-containing protein
MPEGSFFQDMADTLPCLIWSARADGVSDYYNARFLEYLGKTHEEMYGWNWTEALHPDDRQRSLENWTAAFTSGTGYYEEYRIRRAADGCYIWHEGRAMPLRNASGQIVRWFGTCTDIEERKLSEKQRDESAKKLHLLYESMQDAFVSVSMDGQIREFNTAYLDLLGYSPEEILTKTYLDLTPKKWHADEAKIVSEQVLPRGYSEVYEKEYRRKDGILIPIELRTVLIRADDGTPESMWAIIRDITEKKRVQQELTLAKDLAETASRAKSEFLATISHEIRTPITGIVGMAELLEGTTLNPTQKSYLSTILSSSDTLLALINDILDLAKIEAGQLHLERCLFCLRECIRDVARNHIPIANSKGLAFKVDIPDDIPDELAGDPLRLKQILFNLIGNAIKFTSSGEVSVTVSFDSRTGSVPRLVFAVSDTGIGISQDAMDHLFTPFTQADMSISREFGGTGLGLSICLRLAEKMGGEIRVESHVGIGTTFRVYLPFTVDGKEPESKCFPKGEARPVSNAPHLRVLLAEDNEVSRFFLTELLHKLGHQVEVAANGAESLELWRRGGFDLVLMDVQMPVMGGLEAVSGIRQAERVEGGHVPVIALTAHAMKEDRERFLNQGFDGYVAKPLKTRDLLGEIERCLSSHANGQRD